MRTAAARSALHLARAGRCSSSYLLCSSAEVLATREAISGRHSDFRVPGSVKWRRANADIPFPPLVTGARTPLFGRYCCLPLAATAVI